MSNFNFASIKDLRASLDKKEISSVELTKNFLERITRIDPELNSYITVIKDGAMDQAKRADEFIGSVGENPLLCGIPYAAKDLFCTKGQLTTAASKILYNYKPPYNATVVNKITDQYGVLLGKTNLDQFAHGSSTTTSAYGPTKNPWDKERIPGGSSGGSSAAVAAGLTPWALATETGGSIRQPSSLCGVSGWKPTYGRVSRYGVIAMGSSLDSIGAMAHTVEDLALIAELISGRDPKDSTTGHVTVDRFSKNLTSDLKGLRIGVPKEYFPEGIEEGTKSAVNEAIKKLEGQGARIIEVSLPSTPLGSLVYAIICPSEISSNLSRYDGIRYGHVSKEAHDLLEVYTKTRSEGFGDEAKRRILTGTYVLSHGYYDAYYRKAQKVRRLILNEFESIFKTVDLLACPASPNVAVPIEGVADDPLFGYIADQLNIPSSLAGLPALSIPCGFAESTKGKTHSNVGLPVGLQLIGPQWGEQTLFNVGYTYQQITDWHNKYPKQYE